MAPSLTYEEGKANSIPRLEWKENPAKKGSKKSTAASKEVKSDFLLKHLMDAVNGHLAYEKTGATPTVKKEEAAVETSPPVELPF